MITGTATLARVDKTTGEEIYNMSLKGLKADTKPTEKWDGMRIGNGSSFMEIDDAGFYMYDEESDTWKSKA